MTPVTEAEAPAEFSPTVGGPLHALFQRLHLSGPSLEFFERRVLVVCAIAWLPLLILALLEHRSVAATGALPFWYDISVHVRLLIALPVLLFAEVHVHGRIRPLIKRFVDRRIISPEDMPKFKAAVNSALKARNSVPLEVLAFLVVYTAGVWVWRSKVAMTHATWYAIPDGMHLRLTYAGYWFAFVSVPIVQFMLLRWYVRLCIWFVLLWKISRLKLHLIATHPDHAGGIGFLGKSSYAFGPLLFAQGCLISGFIANRAIFEKASLMSFKMEAAGMTVFFVACILGPLVMFWPKMMAAKHKGAAEFALLASDYVLDFDQKWIRGGSRPNNLLGTHDIQSLADLGNSFRIVEEMRAVPFSLKDTTRLAIATAAPLLPLGLLVMPLAALLKLLLKVFFHV